MKSPAYVILSVLFFVGYCQLIHFAITSLPLPVQLDTPVFAVCCIILLPLSLFSARWTIHALGDTLE